MRISGVGKRGIVFLLISHLPREHEPMRRVDNVKKRGASFDRMKEFNEDEN